ncbi:MAG: hypothetical protein ACTSX6_00305 [Candidatus Heimdallarchaeaceae archaeon]
MVNEIKRIYLRKEIYDPKAAKYVRETIASNIVQQAAEITGTGADADVTTYSVPSGNKLYIYAIGINGEDAKLFKIQEDTTVIDYQYVEANKQSNRETSRDSPLYVISGGKTFKITCVSSTAATKYRASFTGELR